MKELQRDSSELDSLLSKEVQDFVMTHEGDDTPSLLLKKKEIHGVRMSLVVEQINGRRKAKTKLPEFYSNSRIIYPPTLNLEQCSSEATARFKAGILSSQLRLNRGADLTGGFGVDSYYMSRLTAHFDYVEPDKSLGLMAKHNHGQLGARNITYHHKSAQDFLASLKGPYDFLFLDPSRRSESRRVITFAQASPDVVALRSALMEKASLVMIKASPLLDLQKGVEELGHVSEVFVVSVGNECKEVIFNLEIAAAAEPGIHAIDLDRHGNIRSNCSFSFTAEKRSESTFSDPLHYLYEPGNALLKAGGFKWVGNKFALHKLAPSTHLYTSERIMPDFPGRIFKILEPVKLQKGIRQKISQPFINILARNYPLSVDQIKAKTGLKEGGELYLICARSPKGAAAFLAERVV